MTASGSAASQLRLGVSARKSISGCMRSLSRPKSFVESARAKSAPSVAGGFMRRDATAPPCVPSRLAEQLAQEALLLLQGPLGLVAAALRLEVTVAGHRATGVLQPALGLVGGALYAVLVRTCSCHVRTVPGGTHAQPPARVGSASCAG